MSRREAWLSAAFVFALALVVRVVAAALVPFPIPEDTAYYHGVARNLVEGRGLVSDALWSYGTPPLVFPRPAFEVWLPLPSLLAAPFMALFGTAYRAAQVVPVVAGAVVAVLAWRLAADVAAERGLATGRARTLALGTGVTAAAWLPLVLHSTLVDSTMPFAALALGACLLMWRLAASPRGARLTDPRLPALGALLGLAALTRNEAAWLALAWVGVAWFGAHEPAASGPASRASVAVRLRLVGIAGVVALAVFAPWMVRDTLVFGSPFPGQALTNALSVTGFDIFAWSDPPTLSRYLAQGPAFLVESRLGGLGHNLLSVLLVPSFPVGLVGLVALPWTGRRRVLRPLLVVALLAFLVTSLAFPVATTWGTFLHAAGPVHVLLLVSCLVALDGVIARVGVVRGWTRPVAWLGPALTASVALLLTLSLVGFGGQSRDVEARYAALRERLAPLGIVGSGAPPVISDFPIWFAETQRTSTLALPDEPPASVLDLAERFGARYLVMAREDHGRWPAVLTSDAPGAHCFRPLDLGADATAPGSPIADVRVFRIDCR